MSVTFKATMNDETFQALKRYIIDKHGLRRALSIEIEQAVREYLEREKKEKKEG